MVRQRKGRRPRGDGAVFFSESKGCWVFRAITGHKPDGSVSYTEGRARTQAEAIAKRRAAEAINRQPDADKETVGHQLNHWLHAVAKPNTRPNTWVRYGQVCRIHLEPRVGGIPLRKFTVPQVTKLWAKMSADGVAAGTVKKCSEVLAAAMESAVSEGRIPVAPTRKAKKPKVHRPPIETFNDDEIKAILKAADAHPRGPLFKLAVATGARQGEILALERDDFDFAAGTVRIVRMLDQLGGELKTFPPKSANGDRTLAVPPFALEPVRRYLSGRDSGPVFTTRSGGYILKSNFVRKDWTPLLETAGVPYRKFHTLRHTLASRLLTAGVDVAEVARVLGDRIETITRSYAHWMNVPRQATADRIQNLYG